MTKDQMKYILERCALEMDPATGRTLRALTEEFGWSRGSLTEAIGLGGLTKVRARALAMRFGDKVGFTAEDVTLKHNAAD